MQRSSNQAGGPLIQPFEPSRPVRATNYTPRRSRTVHGRALRNAQVHRTADEILGLAPSIAPPDGSLDAEIKQYLEDHATGTTSLMYWQVNLFVVSGEWISDYWVGESASLSYLFLGSFGLSCHSRVCCPLRACFFISKRNNDGSS